MRYSLVFIIFAIVLFLIPPLLVLLDETVQPKTLLLCGFGGLAAFAAGHLPLP